MEEERVEGCGGRSWGGEEGKGKGESEGRVVGGGEEDGWLGRWGEGDTGGEEDRGSSGSVMEVVVSGRERGR